MIKFTTYLFFYGLIVFCAWLITKLLINQSGNFHLVQIPNHRSSHVKPTPSGGGLSIVILGTLIAIVFIFKLNWQIETELLLLGTFIAIIGFIDDIVTLSARIRFSMQSLVSLALLLFLHQMPDIHVGDFFVLKGMLLNFLLLITAIWWMNLFNFMDGIDGIAASQAIYMLTASAFFAFYVNPHIVSDPVWQTMLCLAAATLGFILLNWSPAKIFMGDAGSLYLAFILFGCAMISVKAEWFAPSVGYSVWLVLSALFVVDATMTLVRRIIRNERWYEAHRSHAYQKLARRFGRGTAKHSPVTLLAIFTNVIWLGPLAFACIIKSDLIFLWLMMAYLPVIFFALKMGAGVPD